jgi:hypothetical protein
MDRHQAIAFPMLLEGSLSMIAYPDCDDICPTRSATVGFSHSFTDSKSRLLEMTSS